METEDELIQDWFEQLRSSRTDYEEPFFGEITNSFVKKSCDALKQDAHVFVTALDILEKFARAKEALSASVDNEIYLVCVCILIASKCTSDTIELKAKHVDSYLKKVAKIKDDPKTLIKEIELDILKTLNGRIPLTTRVDDVNTLVEKFVRDFNLNVSIRALCVEILQLLCVVWKDFFYDLRSLYAQNEEAMKVFRLLITNRLYLPIGILVTALKLTNYRFIFNLKNIVSDYSYISRIHMDHIEMLSNKMILVVGALRPLSPKSCKQLINTPSEIQWIAD